MRQGERLYYFQGDHLGSTSLTTDRAGRLVAETRYQPYGQERWSSGATPTDFGFTGQRHEASFGLLDYNARYYSPVLGRFISPDSIVPAPGSAGGFNRYAYTYNNPLKYVDPSGHIGICFQGSPDFRDPAEDSSLSQLCNTLSDDGRIEGEVFKYSNTQNNVLDAFEQIQQAKLKNPGEAVTIIGYSWGGAAALELADMLNRGKTTSFELGGYELYSGPKGSQIKVDELILIDPVNWARGRRGMKDDWLNYPTTPTEIPDNVTRTLNLYATNRKVYFGYQSDPHTFYLSQMPDYPIMTIPAVDLTFSLKGNSSYQRALNVPIDADHQMIMTTSYGLANKSTLNPTTLAKASSFLASRR
jgi:RHS repeat-associated protein